MHSSHQQPGYSIVFDDTIAYYYHSERIPNLKTLQCFPNALSVSALWHSLWVSNLPKVFCACKRGGGGVWQIHEAVLTTPCFLIAPNESYTKKLCMTKKNELSEWSTIALFISTKAGLAEKCGARSR